MRRDKLYTFFKWGVLMHFSAALDVNMPTIKTRREINTAILGKTMKLAELISWGLLRKHYKAVGIGRLDNLR